MQYQFLSTVNHFDIFHITTILKKNRIDFFLKNTHESSIVAGWFDPGSVFNEQLLFVDITKLDLVRLELRDYLNKI